MVGILAGVAPGRELKPLDMKLSDKNFVDDADEAHMRLQVSAMRAAQALQLIKISKAPSSEMQSHVAALLLYGVNLPLAQKQTITAHRARMKLANAELDAWLKAADATPSSASWNVDRP